MKSSYNSRNFDNCLLSLIMKNLFLCLILSIISSSLMAAENLILSCEGEITGVARTQNGQEEDLRPTKYQGSYIFKNGNLTETGLPIKCVWTDKTINCEDITGKPHSVNKIVLIDRITGHVDAMTSYLDGKGELKRREDFSGVCNKVKQKF